MKRRSPRYSLKRSLGKASLTALIGMLLLITLWIIQALIPVTLPSPDQPIQLYATQTGDDLQQIFSSSIQRAKNSVLLIVYSLSDPQIISLLRQKGEAGLDVRVICDSKTSSPSLAKRLGSKVRTFRWKGKPLMHQKLLVVDQEEVWIGSANFTSESLRFHANLVTAMISPTFAQLIQKKSQQLQGQMSSCCGGEDIIGDQKIELSFFPDEKRGPEKIKQLIDTAQKSLRVAMFTWTRQDLAERVLAAKRRGVKVDVVIDHCAGKGAGAKIVEMLRQGGIPVRLSQGTGLLHHKLLYIDGKTLVNGSANWTEAAFTKNEDCFIILHNLTESQQIALERLWDVMISESEAVSLESEHAHCIDWLWQDGKVGRSDCQAARPLYCFQMFLTGACFRKSAA